MNFGPDLAQLVRQGRKTSLRLLTKAAEPTPGGAPLEPCPYVGPTASQPGCDYGIQAGPGKRAIGRVEILNVRRERLDQINDSELQAEGFKTLEEFRDDFKHRHDIDPDEPTPWDAEVWVVTFKTLDQDLYLAKATVQADYTKRLDQAVPGEVGAVDPAIVETLPTSRAALRRWQIARAGVEADHQTLPLAERVTRALALADAAGIDTSRYEASMLRRVEALESRTRKTAA